MHATPTYSDIQAARHRIAGRVRRTPLIRSDWLSDASGGDVYLKLESLQVTNSFKARGTMNAVLALRERLPADAAAPQIVTASAGNHGRALAWAAQQLGLRVIVFTPADAPATKLEAIRRHGADLRAEAVSYDEAERTAQRFAAETGALFLSPYSHPDMIAGLGTIGSEILEELPGTARMLVPVGGGGLIAGIALAVHALAPDVETVGVEVENSHAFTASLAAGRIVEVEVLPTLADGLAGNMDPENLAFPLVQQLVRSVVMVSEGQLAAAMRGLVEKEHLVAEGAGATGVAAVLAGRVAKPAGPTVVVVSGSNIDLARLKSLL